MAPRELTEIDGNLAHVPVTMQGCLMAQKECWSKIWKLIGGVMVVFAVLAGLTISSHLILSSKTDAVAQKLTDRDEARARQFDKLLDTNDQILKQLKGGVACK